jgi:hypothetical protein
MPAAACAGTAVDGRNIGRGPSNVPTLTENGFAFDPRLPLPLPALARESSPISTMLTPLAIGAARGPLPLDTLISLELFGFMMPGRLTRMTNGRAFTARPVPRLNFNRARRLFNGSNAPAGFPPAAAAAAAAARAAFNCANRVVAAPVPPRAPPLGVVVVASSRDKSSIVLNDTRLGRPDSRAPLGRRTADFTPIVVSSRALASRGVSAVAMKMSPLARVV